MGKMIAKARKGLPATKSVEPEKSAKVKAAQAKGAETKKVREARLLKAGY